MYIRTFIVCSGCVVGRQCTLFWKGHNCWMIAIVLGVSNLWFTEVLLFYQKLWFTKIILYFFWLKFSNYFIQLWSYFRSLALAVNILFGKKKNIYPFSSRDVSIWMQRTCWYWLLHQNSDRITGHHLNNRNDIQMALTSEREAKLCLVLEAIFALWIL